VVALQDLVVHAYQGAPNFIGIHDGPLAGGFRIAGPCGIGPDRSWYVVARRNE
jgi:hypothetical protein